MIGKNYVIRFSSFFFSHLPAHLGIMQTGQFSPCALDSSVFFVHAEGIGTPTTLSAVVLAFRTGSTGGINAYRTQTSCILGIPPTAHTAPNTGATRKI